MISFHNIVIIQTKLIRFTVPYATIPMKRHKDMCLWLDVKEFETSEEVYFSSLDICRSMVLK